jgi:nucleoid-associated protein YgaU
MPTRYNKDRKLINDSSYYAPLRKSRDKRAITHYATKQIGNPTVADRASLKRVRHVWKYGDRLYTLAHKYYGDSEYWWVIAWWNGYGTEATIKNGAVLAIPLNIEEALKILGV